MIVAWKNYTAEETPHRPLKVNSGVKVSVPSIRESTPPPLERTFRIPKEMNTMRKR